jgi:membrane-bound metal-dependent hydrolase YbcI (DUF457 family)
MRYKAHMAVGIAASLYVAKLQQVELDFITVNQAIGIGALLGLVSDIDKENSKLGNKIPLLPYLLEHRGPTHRIYFCIGLVALIGLLNPPIWMLWCMFAAVVSHSVGDMLTADGIAFFEFFGFFDYTFRFPILKYAPWLEKVIEVGSYLFALNILIT